MKEATGELGTTLLVIIAIIAVMSILTLFVLPSASKWIGESFNDIDKSRENCKYNEAAGQVVCE